jgi:hypothetical protein
MSMKNSNDTIENRTRDLPVVSKFDTKIASRLHILISLRKGCLFQGRSYLKTDPTSLLLDGQKYVPRDC